LAQNKREKNNFSQGKEGDKYGFLNDKHIDTAMGYKETWCECLRSG
jgi:hypothetical protein